MLILGLPLRLPIEVVVNVALLLQAGATISNAVTRDATFDSHTTFDAGILYADGQWQGSYSLTPTNTFSLGVASGQSNAGITRALVPKVSFIIYGAAGPYTSVGLQEERRLAQASSSLDWDFLADVWLRTTVGATGKVFGKDLSDFKTSWDTSKLSYKTPDHLERTDGDGQTGTAGKALPKPIKVRVLASKDISKNLCGCILHPPATTALLRRSACLPIPGALRHHRPGQAPDAGVLS